MAVDLDVARALLDQRKSSKGEGKGPKVRWVKPPDMGEIKVRFLPPVGDSPVPGKVVIKHYGMPENETLGKSNITCLQTWGMDCPICNKLKEFKEELSEKQLRDFTGASSYFNVLVLAGKNSEGEESDPTIPYVLQLGEYGYEWLLQQIVNEEVGDITDPYDGSNVTLRRKKTKGAFERIIARKPSPIADNQEDIDLILDQMYDLDAIWRSPDDAYVNIAYDIADALDGVIDERLRELRKSDGNKRKPVKEVRDAKSRRQAEQQQAEEPEPEEPEEQPSAEEEPEEQPQQPPKRPVKLAPAPPKKAPAKEEAAPTPAPSAKRTPAKSPNKPSGSPECFGQHGGASSKKCSVCPFEYDCEGISSK